MKKITLLLITTMVLVLAFGSAYAMEMTDGRTNGVTVFKPGNYVNVPSFALQSRSYTAESAAGRVMETESNLKLNNGITIFAETPVDFDSVPTYGVATELIEVGSAAGGLSEDNSPLGLYDGATIFDKGVIDADVIPAI